MSVKLKVITIGDRTTTGGTVKNGALTVFCQNRLVALIGSESYCPQCKTLGVIRKANQFNVLAENKQICLENDVIECRCPIGTNRLIASPDAFEFIGYDDGSVGATISHEEKKKKTGVDAGFCVIPHQSTTESFENTLFAGNQPDGTRELYRSLNGEGKEYKAGSIMLLVDPEKQDDEQIAHMKAAKRRIDTALEPLTHQEASFLHNHYGTIANFSNIADKGIGLTADPAGKYFKNIEEILKKIQETYKNTYMTRGALIGEQFYVRRAQLFKELEKELKVGFLNKAMKFGEYTKIKYALGLSTSSITHKWNETGISDIEGYATHIERAAKYVAAMRYIGYVGIGFSALHSINEINKACTIGREDECTKKKYTEIGSLAGSTGGGILTGGMAVPLCIAIGVGTAGTGGLVCAVIAGGALGYVGGEVGGWGGEKVGNTLYNVIERAK